MYFKSRLLAVMIAAGSTPFAMAAGDGTITFNGLINSETCVVKVNGGSANAAVVLPTVAAKTLGTVGQTAGLTQFTMELTDCGDVSKKAYAFFEAGSTVDPRSGNLKNATGTAKGVQLQLVDVSSTKPDNSIKVGQESQRTATTQIATTTEGKGTLPYGVQYFAEGAITAGTVISSVTYTIAYP
ncbi:MAG: fimbrial protein [Pseudomonas sp.]